MERDIRIFSGTSDCEIAGKIAKELDLPLGKSKVLKFKDGEYYTKLEETVRGADVFVVQSTSTPVNENLMGLLVFTDALKRASAKSINLVIPYYGYSRQDRKASGREPITAKLVGNLLTTAGATRVITLDLHTSQTQGFFDIPSENLESVPTMVKKLKKEGLSGEGTVVVATHSSRVKMARIISEGIEADGIAIVDRRENKNGEVDYLDVIGDVEGKKAILIDDMISVGDTMITSAKIVKEKGAKGIFGLTIHAVLLGDTNKKIEESPIEKLFFTDSIEMTDERNSEKFEIVSVSGLFAKAIKRIAENISILPLYQVEK